MLYQHPLAYLLGLEGLALLRAYEGEYGAAFTHERFEEIRRLLDTADELGDGVEAREISSGEVYARWAAHYDEPGNELMTSSSRSCARSWERSQSAMRSTQLAARVATPHILWNEGTQ